MLHRPPVLPLVVILGSTGTGKSDLAVELATCFNGEIINADAMQMYKGLPIITNKISKEEQRSVPHHLLGNVSLDEETWVVGVFKREANKIIQEIRSRGRLPIVVGGTNYYVQALLFKDGLVQSSDESPTASQTRDWSVEYPILEDSTEAIRKKLQEVDPVMADRWHPNDRRKMRRSLEIYLSTGKRASDIYAEQQERKAARVVEAADTAAEDNSEPMTDPLLFWVHTEDKKLKERLDRRVDKMLDFGLMDEVREMHEFTRSSSGARVPLDMTRGIWQSIGYKQILPYLEAVEEGVAGDELEKLRLNCLENMKTATRRYAKDQRRWIAKEMMPLLRGDSKLDRLYVLDSTDITQYAEQVSAKAIDLTQRFLAGQEMVEPLSTSGFAREVLTAAGARSLIQKKYRHTHCEVCNTTATTEEEWEIHIRGRPHRRKVQKTKKFAMVLATERKPTDAEEVPNQVV